MGRSGDGKGEEKKKGVKRGRRPSRPPWSIPEEAERPKERVAGRRREETRRQEKEGNRGEEGRRERSKKVREEDVKRMGKKAAGPSTEKTQALGASKKVDGKFNVMEHMDLLSGSSSEDMDLASDHEKPSAGAEKTPTSAEASCIEDLQLEDSPHTDLPRKVPEPESGVTMSEGGPGTQLHWELVEYDRRSQLTPIEARRRTEVVSIVTDAALRVCPGSVVMPFGGYANGLCTPASDLDLVIVGVATPNAEHGGYKDPEKGMVGNLLGAVLSRLRHGPLDLKKHLVIRRARIPIIKATTDDDIEVDISICDDHGPRAADFMRKQVQTFAPLRPLVLALKSLLKDRHLNEVVTGGMGTYALSNMVLAHLMEDRKKAEQLEDFGCLLVSFLKTFGKEFNFYEDAVSIRRGGICHKSDVINAGVVDRKNYEVNFNRRQNDGDPPWERLVVEDYFTGRDVSSGTYRIGEIQKLFGAVHKRLSRQFLIPPLPPDSPYLSTLSTLFEIKGVTKPRKSHDDGAFGTPEVMMSHPPSTTSKRQRFSETREVLKSSKIDIGMRSASTVTPKNTSFTNGNNSRGHQEPLKDIHALDRADFVDRVKMILRAPR